MKIDRKKVDAAMAENGITPKIVAERLGITPVHLSILWSGRRESRVSTVTKIADAIRVSIKDITV